jgi:ferrous iron transport protein B
MKKIKVPLIGQPNVGKSSLLNSLVGPKSIISNYPGTTVEVTRARKKFKNTDIEFIDTPGIYSISDRSQEEKVTKKLLLEEKIDGAVIVADATSLERSLYMILQILEAKIPVVIALNFIESAEEKGLVIDCEKLEKILNVDVIPINPFTKKGLDEFLDATIKINQKKRRYFRTKYDDHIEDAIDKLSSKIKGNLSKRFVSLRALEGDENFYEYLDDKSIVEKTKKNLKQHPKIAEDISITRYGTASFISQKVTQITSLRKENKLEEKIDKILLHKTWGQAITILSLVGIFGILLLLGNLMQGFLMTLTDNVLSSFDGVGNSFMGMILSQGLTGLVAGISIALPYVFLFYFILGLLEDIGILSRFIVNSERMLGKIGLPGKAFIPMLLGLGCSASACRCTRVLPCKKEQFHAASLFSFVPCSSRIAIIMGIVGFYGGIQLAMSVFFTIFITGIIWALIVKRITHIESSPLIFELPPYRRPLIKNVLAKGWIRMQDFVYIVTPLLALGGIVYAILDVYGFVDIIVSPFLPVTEWLGLPSETIIPLVMGFLQKDLTGAMLVSVLGNEIGSVLTPVQIYTFGVASTIGIPCIIAWGMLVQEFGLKKSSFLVLISIAYGLLVAGVMWRIISFI